LSTIRKAVWRCPPQWVCVVKQSTYSKWKI